jgi:hypothetical protein
MDPHDDSIVTGATTDDRGRGTHSGAVDSVTCSGRAV